MKSDPREQRGWTRAAVGCYWTRGDYTISSCVWDGCHGYHVVTKQGERVGPLMPTFEEAERLCERRALTAPTGRV